MYIVLDLRSGLVWEMGGWEREMIECLRSLLLFGWLVGWLAGWLYLYI